ncbi:hypothetical protein [Pseudofrankia inefficax]|uniref:EthD domain-containing protein n=1 Tax=Pseudofrankia inefficax (strain DSM 45817 / CECT 9037 / DDB 130130 / EuI1c) TaxID=298654 RepID=E3IU42_PSEI1|nr:hypothetical protein [Pseudofrankia inefficax]ADP81235.1 hypothetical protein FraEuI1c_3222 [Pseudofrankia inefficax]
MRPDRMVVLSSAKPGQEDAYHNWYNNVHAPDVFHRREGYATLQRYELTERQLKERRYGYIAIWELQAGRLSDALASISELRKVKQSGDHDPQDTLYQANPGIVGASSAWYTPLERIDHPTDSADAEDDCLFTVFSNNVPGTDDEFQAWYSQHAHDVVFKLDGFKSAERFIAAPEAAADPVAQYLEKPQWQHLVIYRIAAGNVPTAQDAIVGQRAERAEAVAAGRPPRITLTDTMIEPHLSWWWQPITGVLTP